MLGYFQQGTVYDSTGSSVGFIQGSSFYNSTGNLICIFQDGAFYSRGQRVGFIQDGVIGKILYNGSGSQIASVQGLSIMQIAIYLVYFHK